MAEPSTTSIAVTSSLGIVLATFLTGIDVNTLLGAFAGASLFVMSAKEVNAITRLLYLNIGVVMGYLSGPAMLSHLFTEPVVAAFVFSAAIVTLGLKIIDSVEQIDITRWLKPPK